MRILFVMNPHTETLVQELEERSVPLKADWWNRYMKGEIRFVGTSIPEIRKLLLEKNSREKLDQLPMNQQVSMVNALMRSQLGEHKLAAILYIQLFWLGKQKNSFLLSLISDWFDERYIHDWNTTDWLSLKVLTCLIDSGDEQVIWTLKRWNRDPYLWKARASLVPFSQVKNLGAYSKTIKRFADIMIRREERFAKTAVGWVMREYSRLDEAFVLEFFSSHVKHTTWEVKRNALKYYRQKLKKP
ncbi:MAG: DNA alkylation repair protein [Bacteroidales bacterium]|nr:DNA alkylation repair protein [Bacteroidales bacterium]